MKIAVFDPFCGVSGNMILGALVDAGLDPGELKKMLQKLGLAGWELSADRVTRSGLGGTLVTVTVPVEKHARRLSEILEIISSSELPQPVIRGASRAFERLALAEAAAHGISVDEVHFHEVGAMDAIIDIVGSFCGFHAMGFARIYSSPVATGTGTVECAHGMLPVPAPATVNILEGIPVRPTGLPHELTTPTGAAILYAAVDEWNVPPPVMKVSAAGYGAGHREMARPNLLRVMTGETEGGGSGLRDNVNELRTLVDDMDPRIWPEVSRLALAAGALDCYAIPCIGKKGRPALEVTAICPESSTKEVLDVIFLHTTTLGIRVRPVDRVLLERSFRKVVTEYGEISVKTAFLDDGTAREEPEFGDCAAAAARYGVPVARVIRAARNAAYGEMKKR